MVEARFNSLQWSLILNIEEQAMTQKFTAEEVRRAAEKMEREGYGGKILAAAPSAPEGERSEEHTSELQSLMRISYAVFCLKKKKKNKKTRNSTASVQDKLQ